MAIHGKITVEVIVNDQALQEYEDHDMVNENPNIVEKHVEATSGAAFSIKISVAEPSEIDCDALAFETLLDGKEVETPLLIKARFRKVNKMYKEIISGVRKNGYNTAQLKPFVSREIAHTEEAFVHDSVEDTSDLEDVGSITVNVFRTRGNEKSLNQEPQPLFLDTDGVAKMAEKKLKGSVVTHSYRLGEEQSTRNTELYSTESIDGEDKPIAIFKFMYCSRKGLQDMLLIPRTPTPAPLEERPLNDLNTEELRELAKRQQARLELNVKPEKKIKLERIEQERGVKHARDTEYEEILASATVKKVKVPIPFAQGETVEIDDN